MITVIALAARDLVGALGRPGELVLLAPAVAIRTADEVEPGTLRNQFDERRFIETAYPGSRLEQARDIRLGNACRKHRRRERKHEQADRRSHITAILRVSA